MASRTAALALAALLGAHLAGAARVRSAGGSQTMAAAGQLLRDRYLLEEFVERRWNFGPGGWPGQGGWPGRGGWPGQGVPAPAPVSGGVPGKSFPDIKRRGLSSPQHLGTGSFGDVWAATDRKTGMRVAVKIFYTKRSGTPRYLTWQNAQRGDRAEFTSAMKECSLVKQIMAYKDSDPVGASRICECYEEHVSDAEGTSKPVFLVMEMCGLSLTQDFINKHKQRRSVDVPGARELTKHMLEGLDFMSSFSPPLIHHDLKPDNVVVTDKGQLKIIDWGALVLGDPKNVNQRVAATPLYTPPEASNGRRAFSMPAHSYDVYAVGLMYMEMLCPALDYQTWFYSRPLSASKVSGLVRKACPSLPSAQIAADLQLIGAMIHSTPSKRPEPSSVLKSGVFGGSNIRRRLQAGGALAESALLPLPEADDAESDPITGSHVFDPAEMEAPTNGSALPLAEDLELLPPNVYGGLGIGAGLQVRAVAAGMQPGDLRWTFDQCVLNCDGIDVEMVPTQAASVESYAYAKFAGSIPPGSSRCSMYAVGTRALDGRSTRVRSLAKTFSLVRRFWR